MRAAAKASRFVLIVSTVLLLVAIGGALGCAGQHESLVGTWTSAKEDETLDFRADGTLYFTRADGQVDTLRWQSDESHLAIGVQGGGTETLGYSLKHGVLTLTFPGEKPAAYTRVELQGGTATTTTTATTAATSRVSGPRGRIC